MQQPVPQQKNTPSRRRPGGRNRNTPQKTYASENDIPTYKPTPSISPSTPQKAVSGVANSVHTTSAHQKSRNKNNKNKNKNGAASPVHIKQEGGSPPLSSGETTGPIFAGASFHASPAPSALPIPSFLSRSISDSPMVKTKSTPAQEPSPPTTDSDEASPPTLPVVPRNEESPLDIFFRADRAEKEKTRRPKSASAGDVLGPFSPPHESPKECSSVPKEILLSRTQRLDRGPRTAPSAKSTSDRVGNLLNPQPIGPAFSTPYQDRIRAARASQTSGQNSVQSSPSSSRTHGVDPAAALKRYLFTGQLSPETQRQPLQSNSQSPSQHHPQQQLSTSSPPDSGLQLPLRQSLPAVMPKREGQPQSHQPQPPRQQYPPGMFPASILTNNASSARVDAPHQKSAFRPNQKLASRPNQKMASGPKQKLTSEPNDRSEQIFAMEDHLRRALKLPSSN
ncbi:hypothetical protein F4778DRAFT_96204 [Xylariomycetidae sp. FL2044]|nr:hypothetical protein F4778DRAFT_96204 [Xylariomycetidae sp. FL2044]